jgi:hypothetical protein
VRGARAHIGQWARLELLTAFPSIELTGDPIRLRSNVVDGYRLVPVRLG